MIERKSHVLANPELTLLLAGILTYKGLGILNGLVSKLLLLILPLTVSDRLRAVVFWSYGLDALVVFGLIWLIYATLKNRGLPILTNRRVLLTLGITFIVLLICRTLLNLLGEESYSGIWEEYTESEDYGIGIELISHQLASIIINYIKGLLLLILFFLSLRRHEEKTPSYEWPITAKNEEVVSSSFDSDVSELPDGRTTEETSLIQDIIYFKDDKCALIWGNHEEGYTVTESMSIDELPNPVEVSWESVSVSFKEQEGDLVAMTGETSWGGAGFICLKEVNAESFEWFILLSTMNNPTGLNFKNGLIEVNTDLNFPHGVLYTIPAFSPEKFTVQPLTGEDSIS